MFIIGRSRDATLRAGVNGQPDGADVETRIASLHSSGKLLRNGNNRYGSTLVGQVGVIAQYGLQEGTVLQVGLDAGEGFYFVGELIE